MRITFVSNGGKRAVWELPILDEKDEEAILDWVKSNKNNAIAATGFVQVVLGAVRGTGR